METGAMMIRKQVGREREESPLTRAFRLRRMILDLHPEAENNIPSEHVRKFVGRSGESEGRVHTRRGAGG
mgnify:CR=1 FL=1